MTLEAFSEFTKFINSLFFLLPLWMNLGNMYKVTKHMYKESAYLQRAQLNRIRLNEMNKEGNSYDVVEH